MKATLQSVISQVGQFQPIKDLVQLILNNQTCTGKLFDDDFLDPTCLKLAISKSLGYAMILGAISFKMPIISKIIKARGGDGLNALSMYLETSSYLATFIYSVHMNNPITTYGDLFAIIIQNFIIIGLFWAWGISGNKIGFGHKILVTIFFAIFITGALYCPPEYRQYLASYAIVVITLSRLPQIFSNFVNKSVGVQSAFTQVNALIGAAAKTFILTQEAKDDWVQIGGSVLATTLNLILLIQVLTMSSKSDDGKRKNKRD